MRQHDPHDFITKSTAVSPGGEYPRWGQFLVEITGGDAELQDYLQCVSGYCLTGLTHEHAIFFLYGTGANGKSVFISTIAGIMGDYHVAAPIETFTASDRDRHPTELAMLQGARLVTCTETEEGRRWPESRIKQLTGGDQISARFMRQDFFHFVPKFKLMIAGNHKPGLRSVDEAIRRRFNLIPFAVTIPPAQRDVNLAEKLKEEWPGILSWMLEGCTIWRKLGLRPPHAVTSATADYLSDEDAMATWLEECCDLDVNSFTSAAKLFDSWSKWASAAGEYVGSKRRMSDKLETRGFKRARTEDAKGMQGLLIKATYGDDR